MEKEAVRDTVHSFADAVSALGYSRSIGTGKVVPLPSNPDDTVATYKHPDTGQRVCVWPIWTTDDANAVGDIAAKYGLRFVQFGRPMPKQATRTYRPRRTVGQAMHDTGRAPLQADADHKAGRLRALATEAANNAAAYAARGDDKTAHMYHDDAEALSYGAACIESRARRHV